MSKGNKNKNRGSHSSHSSCSSSSSSSDSSSSCSTRPCDDNKCSNECNINLCSLGKDAINFDIWIHQLVDTGLWLWNNEEGIGYALSHSPLHFTRQKNGMNIAKINVTRKPRKLRNTKKSDRAPLPEAPIDIDDSNIDELENANELLVLIDITNQNHPIFVYDKSQLIIDHTYNVAIVQDDFNPIAYITLTQLSFIYSGESEIKLLGNPMYALSPDEIIAIVSYLNKRINCLNVPCCVKERVTDAIMAYMNNFLNPQDVGTYNVLLRNATQDFTSFCGSDNVIPDCGPIYVANVIISEDQLNELNEDDTTANDGYIRVVTRINTINFIINLLRTAQYYLQAFMSSKCCCSGGCKEGDKYMSAEKACKFVFERFCVVDVPLPALDFVFRDWEDTLD